MDPRELTRNEKLFNLLGAAGYILTPGQRSYAYEFALSDGDKLYVAASLQTEIVLHPDRVPISGKVGRFQGARAKSSAYRSFPPEGEPTKVGVGFVLSKLEDVSELISAYRSHS